MEIKEAQKQVGDYVKGIGYDKIEPRPSLVFLHLVEEIGEVSRHLLHKETGRAEKFASRAVEKEIDEEVADVFWQTLKLANILDIDLETAFLDKFEKNKRKPR